MGDSGRGSVSALQESGNESEENGQEGKTAQPVRFGWVTGVMVRNRETYTCMRAKGHTRTFIYSLHTGFCLSDSLHVEYLGSHSVPAIVLDHIPSRNP